MKKSTGIITGLVLSLALIIPTVAGAASGSNNLQGFINLLEQSFQSSNLSAVIASNGFLGLFGNEPFGLTASTTPPTVSLTVNGGSSATVHVGDVINYVWNSTNADTFSSSYSSNNDNVCGSGIWKANGSSGSDSKVVTAGTAGCVYNITYSGMQKSTHINAKASIDVKVLPRDSASTSTPVITVIATSTNVLGFNLPTPIYATPTASFSINGGSSATVHVGDSLTYVWSSTNANKSSSSYTSNDPTRCGTDSSFNTNSLSGSKTVTVPSADLGCTFTVHYKVTQSATGNTADASVVWNVVKTNTSVIPPTNATSTTGLPSSVSLASKPTLALTYNSSRNESSLTGTENIDVKAGNQDVLVTKYGNILYLKRVLGDSINIPNGVTPGDTTYNFTPVSSTVVAESANDQNGYPVTVYRVKAGTTVSFQSTIVTDPQNMYSGVYTVYTPYFNVLVNGTYQQIAVNGSDSNQVPIVGEKTNPTTIPTTQPWLNITSPSASPISSIGVATPLSVSWNENYNSSSIMISIYDSSGKHSYDGTFSGINGENTQTLPSWVTNLPAGQYGVAVSDHNQLDASGHPTSSGVLFNLVSSTNRSPVISSISGPATLSTGQSGKWSVQVSDSQNGSLKYSVNWGDNAIVPLISGIIQTSTFTHTYSSAGTYTPTFTVTNNVGLSATSSITVQVGGAVNTLVPGCTSTVGYSSTTGASCAGSSPDPIAAAGCLPGALYSSTTGALCSTQTTPTPTQSNYSFGIDQSNPLSLTNYVDINNGSQDVPLIVFHTNNSSTQSTATPITQVTANIITNGTIPTGVHLFHGSTELGYQSVSGASSTVTFANLPTTNTSGGNVYSIRADFPANTVNGTVAIAAVTSVTFKNNDGSTQVLTGAIPGNNQYFYHATPQLTFVSAGTTKNQSTSGTTASIDVNFNFTVTPYPGTGYAYSPTASDFIITAKNSSGGVTSLPSKALIITPTPTNARLSANQTYSINLTANDSGTGAGQTVTYYLTAASSTIKDGNGNLVPVVQTWGLDNFHTNTVLKN